MTRSSCLRVAALVSAVCMIVGQAVAVGIYDTKHNLSISGPGPVKSTTEDEICVFCHTPHNARRDIPFLWNKADTTTSYVPYQSSTLQAAVGQPTGASKLCLSCHDGTVALGALLTRPQEIPFVGGLRFIPEGRGKTGTDLSDDHPVSFAYDAALVAADPRLVAPGSLPPQVRLDKNREMQCTACHDPHDNSYGRFLVMSNQYAALCTTCHDQEGWALSSHATSGKPWNGQGANPWPQSTYRTVTENGCASCHTPHSAPGRQRLLNFAVDEDSCLVCHTGNVATKNIANELTRLVGHFVQNYSGGHDAAESLTTGRFPKHVECVDCHNPHRSNAAPASGGRVSGATEGVTGIAISGQSIPQAQYVYEICFKCHADNNVIASLAISRQFAQLNTRLEFDPANPSYHPVAASGTNPNVPSLIPPLTTSSTVSCTDCHGNSTPGGTRGPHGSDYRFLLVRNYTISDNATETPETYALCYTCHSRASILGNQSFKAHKKHVVDKRSPCSACHDAHGVSLTQGNSVNNAALINFDRTIVQPDSLGRLYFEQTGTYRGRCYLNCHGKMHSPLAY